MLKKSGGTRAHTLVALFTGLTRGGQIQSLRVGFKLGFESYQAEIAFTTVNGTPGESVVYL